MGNHSILNSSAVDITAADTWHSLHVPELPDGLAVHNLHLSELLHKSERLDILLPLADLVNPTGLLAETLSLITNHTSNIGLWADTSISTDTLDTFFSDKNSASSNHKVLLQSLELIVFYMPSFVDGRSFSQAKHLRQQGYDGEIRIAGDFGPDQIPYLLRAGFDSFVIANEHVTDSIGDAFQALKSSYDGSDASQLPMFR